MPDDTLDLPQPKHLDLSKRPDPERLIRPDGPLGGPSYSHRGATIDCQAGGYVCLLRMPGHPFDGHSFGVPGTIPFLVDLWIDHQRLPPWYRLAPGAKPET